MKCFRVITMGLWGVLALACGVPPQAAVLARQEAALLTAATDDAAVRSALTAQADAWNAMALLVQRHDAFGTPVESAFVDLVRQTAALTSRQRDLIAQGQDDPALNRQTLEHLRKLWSDAARYLGN